MTAVGGYLVTAVDGVAFGLLLYTVAAGLSLVFGVLDVLNLAHGVLYLAGAYVTYLFADGGWRGLALAVCGGVVAGALGGLAMSALTRTLAHRGHLDQALATLGLAYVAADLFATAFGGDAKPASPPAALAGSVPVFGHAYPVYRLVFIAVALALAVAGQLALARTSLGALVRATVADRDMVRAMGVDTRLVVGAVFAAGAALAVLGGVLGAPILGAGPGVDRTVLVLSLVVVVVGGVGSLPGAFLAALLVGEVQTLGVRLAPSYAPFLLFGVMLTVLAARPGGLVPAVRAT
ncbi:branched-chain amino acid ABC transporter permease [Longispora fulva]|uniref:Branched-chain amino acid transport system permease protein n=1 Tax=Longispora fulva TaxID=619741 RepID=A0A8J7GGY8_9ACTN|nr:branched-chain amino acid ABC transporter permease [Longispora fulva]MBG6134159.1 branched-chain amino acid transport system permease protein [Longispora fulva]GIG62532.1 branched-chain amino acid ABC transporter permease [Longispora fulva]